MSSLLRLGRKQKNSSNPFRIRIFLFLSYSFGIETVNTFIHSRSSLENHTRFQTKMGKVYTRFQTKTALNPYLIGGGTHLYGLYKGVTPRNPGFQVTGPDGDDRRIFSNLNFLFRYFFGCPRIPAA